MAGINIADVFKPVIYENFVNLGNNILANEFGYDHLICAGLNPADESFSNQIVQYFGFTTLGASAFDATVSELPPNYPREMVYYKRNVSNIRDDKNVNLEYFIDKYSNIFLKMDLNGKEYDWFSTLDAAKLQKFKQISIKFLNSDSIDNGIKLYAFGLLNETHYIVKLDVEGDVIRVVYLRKDLIAYPVAISEKKLTIEIPENDDIILNYPTPIPRSKLFSIANEVEDETEAEITSFVEESIPEVALSEVVEEPIPEILDEEPATIDSEPATIDSELATIDSELAVEESTTVKKNKKNKNQNKK